MSRRVALRVLVIYSVALAWFILVASPTAVLRITTEGLQQLSGSVTQAAVERGANVLLFIPAGLLLCYALPRTSRWLVWGLCVFVSLGAEVAQVYLPDRVATPIDVVTNAIGAGIGVLAQAALSRRTAREE